MYRKMDYVSIESLNRVLRQFSQTLIVDGKKFAKQVFDRFCLLKFHSLGSESLFSETSFHGPGR
jgi:hypothetical protein